MLAHTLTGAEEQPTVVFLHGFMGAGDDWQETIEVLAPRFRCVAVDLPGHGASTELPETAYTMEGAMAALLELLDGLGIERCALVGYSMGGRLALHVALHHPERVRRLVLESASPGLADEAERAARRGVDEARALRLETGDFDAFLEDWYRQPLFATLARQPDRVAQTIQARRRNRVGELARSLRQMGTGRQEPLWERLERLPVSTLAVVGALDGKYVEVAERMALRTSGLRVAVIPDVGHNVHLECPAAYADVLREFLSQELSAVSY